MNGPGLEVAFVTGAGSGIGAAVARRLTGRGAAVALFDLAEDKVEATAASIEAEGGRALPLHGDVGDDDAVGQAVSEAVSRLGALTTTVACAGIAVTGTVADISLADWQRTLQVNLTGVFLTARHTIPHMIKAGGGAFTAISSDAGVQGAEGFAAYCASKHGVVGLVRCLALDHGPQGVRANAVCPGFVETPMADQIFAGTGPEARGYYATTVPLGRFARPEEVAGVVAHLTSAEASYTNGMTYVIDGGATAGYFEGSDEPV
ncbi:SDR family NAD(P)-dependent oxidoreductase [Streptomyces sp. NPDC005820]|uniref:SDR family NAD(P)-dependent oxidoreductase n=1 Tax=Streptomyces sp. NPDC005820 TaxID=3157069 RepID=UPI0033FC91A9